MPDKNKAEQGLKPTTYKVGYKKPPLETRFGAERQPDRNRRRATGHPAPDIAALLDEPLQVKSKGKRTKMHLHEATLNGLFKRVLKGEIGAIKKFLQYCRGAGLLEPAALASAGVVVEAPQGVPLELAGLLIREVGLPPWDEEVYEDYRAKYDEECATIAALKEEALRRARSDGKDVF
ncbi:hypothetical protein SAMN05216338_1006200 [Bradyrhizobium sp. Rc2d]|uniref:hypothetical protein n=1 Tax=Bradyrhizobium sp. Rc2d TaxID=1855321 RepID=UPI000888F6BE|nr:hypothetical protein [Bradyrhizobium sp. Rc2d]SDH21479.1 hypothetical protein SAMN05216338_1006200 [Bradyrhizobium sp. Rc2d]